MKHFCFYAILASSFFGQLAKAQVTIGAGISPNKAALLDIKEQEPDEANVTSTRGGMLLARVALTHTNTLEPFIDTTDEDYDLQKRVHTGMFVYNVATNTEFDPGLYIWDGSRWNVLLMSPNPKGANTDDTGGKNPEGGKIPGINEALPLPNSYIVSPGESINIPIIKAYAVWKNLLDTDISIEGDKVSAELLWQDEKGLVSKVSLNEASSNLKSTIRIDTNKGTEGNAIVVVKMNNVIRWSWHIWVTNFDPSKENNQNKADETIFMNRYLGATSSDYGHIGSTGLFYQWGRKDPFSGSAETIQPKEKAHYTIDNKIISQPVLKKAVVSELNLANAIMNPSTYYTGGTDWYSSKKTQYDNHMWVNENGTKGVYDPCPEGWRIPVSGKGNKSVWKGLEGKGKHFDKGKGVSWENYGYYHASGQRNDKGELELIGSEAYVWSAENFFDDQAFRLNVADWNVYPQHSTNRVYAHSVRCVKSGN